MAYTQQGSKLIGTGYVGNSAQGWSASLSADGNTLAIGGDTDDGSIGATWIFTRSGSTWTQQGSKLIGTGATSIASQGWSVALSGDGNTLAIGGPTDDSVAGAYIGAVWIFTRSGGVWTQQGSKLVGTGYVTGPQGVSQGYSVALSNDGNTLAAGGYHDDSSRGATWIWTRTGSSWTQQGSKLVGTGYTVPGSSWQGYSVSLSSDGNTLAIGGPIENTSIGATWIFTRSGGVWTQQGSKLVGTGYTPGPFGPGTPFQGQSVSLSGDSDSLAVGGSQDNDAIGATWVWTRSGGVWTQQGSKLVGTGYVGTPTQGWDISLSGTGDTLAVGGRFDNPTDPLDDQTAIGATWIFTRSGGSWTQQGSKLVGTGGVSSAGVLQGSSVSLSSDSSTLAVGGAGDGSGVGATWIFDGAVATTTTTTLAPTTTTTTLAPTTTTTSTSTSTTSTTTLSPTKKQFTLANTGTGNVTIQSVTFNNPVGIGHIANLSNLGGSSTETGNASLAYSFASNAVQTFTVDYYEAGIADGTYTGNVVVSGSNGVKATLLSTIIIGNGTTTTTTLAPTSTTTTTTTGGGPVSPTGFEGNYIFIKSTPGVASLTLRLDDDGGWRIVQASTGSFPAVSGSLTRWSPQITGNWYSPTTPGIGANYLYRLTVNGIQINGAGTVTPDVTGPGSWLPFSGAAAGSVAITSGSGDEAIGDFTIEIAVNNSGSPGTIVSTTNFNYNGSRGA